MGLYPKHREPFRKHAGYRICTYCGKSIKARGIGTHIRQMHKLVVKTVVNTRVVDLSTTKVNDLSTKVINSSDNLSTKVITQDLSLVSGKDLSECKRLDGKHLYTDLDLRILLAKIIVETYQPRSEVALFNQFHIMDLIEDFEHRFKCSFNEARQANQYIQPGKTFEEHQAFAEKYAHLQYSNHNEKKAFNIIEGANSMGQYQCKNCGDWFMPYSWFEEKNYYNPYPTCINGERHEFSI